MLVPAAASIHDIAIAINESDGVNVADLPPSTTLLVRTSNSLYRIVIWRGTTVTVQGGHHFPRSTLCQFNGSGFGGSVLKPGWIGRGLRMEITAGDRRFVTSPVLDFATE